MDVRPFAGGIRRKRQCKKCSHTWVTYECDSVMMRRLQDRALKIGMEEGSRIVIKDDPLNGKYSGLIEEE